MNQQTQRHDEYDVIICGAGPAGVGAAISLGRAGIRVLLLEQMGCAGGNWTAGLMSIALDIKRKGGIPREIMDAMMQKGRAAWADNESYTYDPEYMKHHLEELLMDARADVLYFTKLTAVTVKDQRITEIRVEGFSSQAYRAEWFIDGTGHGTLSFLAGCDYEIGYPGSEQQQPASLEALVANVPSTWKSDIHSPQKKRELREMLQSVGIDCTYPRPLLFQVAPGSKVWKLAINHQYGVSIDLPESVTRATIDARREINHAVSALRMIPGWEDLTLVTTATQIGIRDNKRIRGLYELTGEDCMTGRTFSDGVVPASYFLDVHQLSASGHVEDGKSNREARPYQIPMRSLIPQSIRNLMIAGRCISGDFFAHSSYRMTNTACATGEAVAHAIRSNLSQADNTAIDGEAVRQVMIKKGYILE